MAIYAVYINRHLYIHNNDATKCAMMLPMHIERQTGIATRHISAAATLREAATAPQFLGF
jgi:hypothetical protein